MVRKCLIKEMLLTRNEDLGNLKDVYETYKPYVDKAKEKTKEYYEEGKQYLNDWYQKYKEGQ